MDLTSAMVSFPIQFWNGFCIGGVNGLDQIRTALYSSIRKHCMFGLFKPFITNGLWELLLL